MTNAQFIEILKSRGYAHKVSGGSVVITHKGSVDLRSLTSLPEGIKFENQGSVYLDSLTSLPEGIKFENQGYVYLRSLTSLPEGIKFENQGSVDLRNLTGEHSYLGKIRDFHCADGYTMLITGKKSYGGHTVYSARYFAGGPVSKMKKAYIAEHDGVTAHGSTMKQAVEDLEYKLADKSDKRQIAAEIKESGKVTLAQFRGLTGACRQGVETHLGEKGINLSDIESMPLDEALSAMAGTFFGDAFVRHIEAV